jgi:metallothiol transferase
MLAEIDNTLGELQEGRIGRREALARVGALALGLAGTGIGSTLLAAEPAATFQAKGLNHIALRVTDIPRSRDFYVKHLGAKVTSESEWNCFLDCGAGHFLALFRSESPGLDHYCYTIDDYRAGPVVERLKEAGLDPVRRENRVYFDDPDGITVQLAAL